MRKLREKKERKQKQVGPIKKPNREFRGSHYQGIANSYY